MAPKQANGRLAYPLFQRRWSVPYRTFTRIGTPSDIILRFAKQKNCDQIVMGTRGLGKVAVFLLGSVAMKVLQLAEIPATSVKWAAGSRE